MTSDVGGSKPTGTNASEVTTGTVPGGRPLAPGGPGTVRSQADGVGEVELGLSADDPAVLVAALTPDGRERRDEPLQSGVEGETAGEAQLFGRVRDAERARGTGGEFTEARKLIGRARRRRRPAVAPARPAMRLPSTSSLATHRLPVATTVSSPNGVLSRAALRTADQPASVLTLVEQPHAALRSIDVDGPREFSREGQAPPKVSFAHVVARDVDHLSGIDVDPGARR